MSNPRSNIQEQLTIAQIAIGNALANLAVQSALDPYGYTAERLHEGQALRDRALACHSQSVGSLCLASTSSATPRIRS
jgi:hypothetical protein